LSEFICRVVTKQKIYKERATPTDMRIILKKGFQKNLVSLAKKGLTWRGLAKKLELSEGYIRNELLKEKTTLAEETYKKLCEIAKKDYKNLVIKRLDENWGKSKGGKNSGSFREPRILVKKTSKELAELVGIILGDGNIWCKNGGYYYTRIGGDLVKDREYLINYVKPLFEKLFKKQMHILEQKKELSLSIGNKDIVHTLKHFGLKEGSKIKNNVKIPPWIFYSKEYIESCIRGLIDTDGSVCSITGRNYPYIWFSCNVPNLRNSFDRAMKMLGIKTSRWNIRKDRTPDIYIGSKEMINKYIKTISFKNSRHLTKIRKYAPVV